MPCVQNSFLNSFPARFRVIGPVWLRDIIILFRQRNHGDGLHMRHYEYNKRKANSFNAIVSFSMALYAIANAMLPPAEIPSIRVSNRD